MEKRKGIIFVLIGAASFGFTPVFVKTGFSSGYSLGQLNLLQILIALIFLWGIIIIRRPSFKGINRKDVMQVLITGSCVGLTSIFYYGAMQYITASLAIILLFQFVWIGILLDWIIGKNKPSRMTLVAVILIISGVLLASNIMNGNQGNLPITGFTLGILAACSYAGFIYFSGKVATDIDPLLRSSIMITGSAILILIVFTEISHHFR